MVEQFLRQHEGKDGSLMAAGKFWWDRKDNGARTEPIRLAAINMYQLVDWVIKPATSEDRVDQGGSGCSFVELIARSEQKPKWFVSHAWSTSILEFTACVDRHAQERAMTETGFYWVYAFAKNQWAVETDRSQESIARGVENAMSFCVGMLLVLDEEAIAFGRAWCCFEALMLIRENNSHLLDIATMVAVRKAPWAANKRFVISKSKFKFARARTYEKIGLVLGCIEAKLCK